jgi:rhamnosyl/mannosyltransferase
MAAEIRAAKADLVHVHWPNPAAVLACLQSGYRGPIVVTYHSDSVRQKVLGAAFEPILHAFLRRTQAILATSPQYVPSSSVLRSHTARCEIVPLGLRLAGTNGPLHPVAAQLRQRYGQRILLTVGRMVYYKGFEYLIQAMAQVNGVLLLVGEGPLRSKLEEVAERSGVAGKVHFLGEVPDTTPYYQACDVFVLPSIARSEAFGLVQIEAMAAGKPVVNTSLDSGVPFVSLDGVTGLTVPPADSRALATAVNLLLEDESLRISLGKAAQSRAVELFSAEVMAAKTMSVYERVLGVTAATHIAAAAPARAGGE